MLALGHQIDPPGTGTTQGGYQADRLWSGGDSLSNVSLFSELTGAPLETLPLISLLLLPPLTGLDGSL